jgi:class 3 adenylate cyclase
MHDAGVTRKLAVLLAADLASDARLMAADGEGTLAALNARRQLVDELIARQRGGIFPTAGNSVVTELARVRPFATIQAQLFRPAAPHGRRRSPGIVEDHAQRVTVSGAHPAHAMPHVDAVDAARAAHRPMMHGKDHAGALA